MGVFVKNTTDAEIKEVKPTVGIFVFPPKSETEIFDQVEEHELPNKKKIDYVKFTALEIANDIVKSRGASGLEVVVKSGVTITEVKPPVSANKK